MRTMVFCAIGFIGFAVMAAAVLLVWVCCVMRDTDYRPYADYDDDVLPWKGGKD